MIGCLSVPIKRCHAQEFDAAKCFPETSVVFAKLKETQGIIQTLVHHPIRKRIESLEDIQTQGFERLKGDKSLIKLMVKP